MTKLSNWGRWGAEDQRGTLNLLTPEVVARATGLVKKGKVYSLGMPVDKAGPITINRNPTWHLATSRVRPDEGRHGTADDILVTYTHAGTHIDALCHAWYGDQLYNGHSYESITPQGSEKNAITNAPWIAARGVLLDIARYRKVERLSPSDSIDSAELEACAKAQGVKLQAGDFVLVRTGWLGLFPRDSKTYHTSEPGLGPDCAHWFAKHDLCGVGADNWAVEIYPSKEKDDMLRVHYEVIRDLGGYLIENVYLDDLARDNVQEFLFVVAPLKISKGLGSPVNPLAMV